MKSDKIRLYVALYARGGRPKMPTLEDTWVLSSRPKAETKDSRGYRYHAKEGLKADGTPGWEFEERDIRVIATQMLLVRVCIGKIQDDNRFKAILRSVPVRDTVEGWNCVHWVKEALKLLKEDPKAMGTSKLDWATVRDGAMDYIQRKKDQHRFDGQGHVDDEGKAPTFDLLENRETIQ